MDYEELPDNLRFLWNGGQMDSTNIDVVRRALEIVDRPDLDPDDYFISPFVDGRNLQFEFGHTDIFPDNYYYLRPI